jgi:hypothetical protein
VRTRLTHSREWGIARSKNTRDVLGDEGRTSKKQCGGGGEEEEEEEEEAMEELGGYR